MTYSEILAHVPVAKSTLSLWLREVSLAEHQKQRITEKRKLAAQRGGHVRRVQRLELTETIKSGARKEIGSLTKRELLLIGATLYWAEGTKEKEYRPGSGVRFSNSDARMVRVFLKWLRETCHVSMRDIWFTLFVHENHKDRLPEILGHWKAEAGLPKTALLGVYFKRNRITLRRNIGKSYFGLAQVGVRRSSGLNRKIAGWVDGMIESL